MICTDLVRSNLNKGKTRGDEEHKGRPKKKKICEECKTNCIHCEETKEWKGNYFFITINKPKKL